MRFITVVVAASMLLFFSSSAKAGFIDSFTEVGTFTKTTDRYGNIGAAYVFSGDDYLAITPNLDLESFSLAFDFYIADQANRWERLFDFGRGNFGDMFLTVNGGRTGGNYELTIHSSTNSTHTVNPGVAAITNAWQHFAVTYDKGGEGMQFFLNGSLLGSNLYNAESFDDWGTSQNWFFGKANWNDPMFVGMMSGFYMTSTVLERQQVQSLASGQMLVEVPAPGSLLLLGLGLLSLRMSRKKHNN